VSLFSLKFNISGNYKKLFRKCDVISPSNLLEKFGGAFLPCANFKKYFYMLDAPYWE